MAYAFTGIKFKNDTKKTYFNLFPQIGHPEIAVVSKFQITIKDNNDCKSVRSEKESFKNI
jgi:hypothetical protein